MELIKFNQEFPNVENETFNFNIDMDILEQIIKNPKDDNNDSLFSLTSNDIKQLKKLKTEIKKKCYYEYKNQEKFGRLYSNTNIQFLNGNIRDTFFYKNFAELDMKKSQFTIIKNLCKYCNIDFDELNKIDVDSIGSSFKADLLKVFNNSLPPYNDNLLKLHNELYSKIVPTFIEKFPDLYRFQCNNTDDKNLNGSFLSYLFQTIENRITTIVIHYLRRIDIDCISLILHDGLFVKKEVLEKLDFNDLTDFIKNNYFKFEVEYKIKELEPLKNLDKLDDSRVDKLSSQCIINNYFEFSKENGSRIIIKDGDFYCCKDDNFWELDTSNCWMKSVFEDKKFQCYLTKQTKCIMMFGEANQWKKLFDTLKLDKRFHCNKNFDFDERIDLLAFTNSKCIKLNKLNKEISFEIIDLLPTHYITMNCGYDLDLNHKDINVGFCYNLMLNCFLNKDTFEVYMKILSTGLYGEFLNKNFFIVKGAGNNGKSLKDCIMNSVLGDYCGTFSSNFFCEKNDDGDIKSTQGVKNIKKRFCSINEPPANRNFNKCCFDSEKIKIFTGITDIINMRLLNQNKVYNFANRATLMCNVNQVPHLVSKDSAINSRFCIIPCEAVFVDKPKFDYQRQIITDITFVKKDWFRNSFLLLLLQYWTKYVNEDCKLNFSQEIIETTAEYLEDRMSIFLNQFYTKTDNKDDFVIFEDIYNKYVSEFDGNTNFIVKEKKFKNDLISKGYIIKKVDRMVDGSRIHKFAILYIVENNTPLFSGV